MKYVTLPNAKCKMKKKTKIRELHENPDRKPNLCILSTKRWISLDYVGIRSNKSEMKKDF